MPELTALFFNRTYRFRVYKGPIAMYLKKEHLDNILRDPGNHIILRLDIELTERCNNNCIHCYIKRELGPAEIKLEMSTGEIKNILKESADLGCLDIRFTGGEPLLRDDFKELYVYARTLGLRVCVATNATLITEDIIKLFKSISPMQKLEVSIYGMSAGSYERVSMVPGSFRAAWDGIDLLIKNNIQFIPKNTIFSFNIDELRVFDEWVKTLPWDVDKSSNVFELNLRCRRDDEKKNTNIGKLRLCDEHLLEIISAKGEKAKKEIRDFLKNRSGEVGNRLFMCGAGVDTACLDPYGKLQACILLRHPDTIYDLRKGSLKEAMTVFFPAMRKKIAVDRDYIDKCGKCFLFDLCNQCPAQSWMEHGTLDTPVDYFCKESHLYARYAGVLKENKFAWED
jgi:radical SAM protein with 4Fe4S-binding SPASM domain